MQILILKTLKKERLTIYEIAKKASLHLHVVQHQLILLKGQDYVKIDFKRKRFKLFAITKMGLNYLRRAKR